MNFSGFKKFLLGHLVAREGYNKPIVEGSTKIQAMYQGVDRLYNFIQKHEPVLFWVLGALFVSGVVIIFIKIFQKSVKTDSFFKRLWLGLLLVFITQFLLVANGPSAKSHYIIPATGLLGLAVFLSWRWPVAAFEKKYKAQLTYKIVYLSLFAVLVFSVISKIPREIHSLEREAASWLEADQFRIENKLINLPTVYYYQSSNVQYALAFGNYLSNKYFSSELSELYPDCYTFHIWSRTLYGSFAGEILKLDDIVESQDMY